MTRILHVIHTPRYSGAEMLVASLTRAHAEMGHRSMVVAINPSEPDFVTLIKRQQRAGVDWITPAAPLKRIARASFIKRIAGQYRPDLIFAHSVIPAIYSRVAGLRNVVPVLHGESNYTSGYHRFSEKILQYRTAGVIAVSEIARHQYAKDFPRPLSKYIANGIDTNGFKVNNEAASITRAEIGINSSAFTAIQVGRISRLKRQHLSVEAIAPIISEDPSIHLILAGLVEDESYLMELKKLARELEVEGNIHFIGPRDDVAHLLCATDLFLMPSIREAQSIAMMEALAAGLPVIGSSIDGLRFASGFSGVCLLDPENIMDFKSAIKEVAAKRPRYERDLWSLDIRETAAEYLRFGAKCMY